MTNQELKEKLLEEFKKEFIKSFNDKNIYLLVDIGEWLSTKLDALLLCEDELEDIVIDSKLGNEVLKHDTISGFRDKCFNLINELIKNQSDKLITKG